MIKLERAERAILIFLVSALILGVAVSAIRKAKPPAKITVEKFNPEDYKNIQSDITSRGEKININTASAEDLMKLKGVGLTLAGRIVEYRYQHGGFASIDDLKSVKGVGVELFEKIKSRVTAE
ncbi:MAG: helix-hairpin-helix domain-containing protein [Candidatus Omnitrophica bacterium]|nr:helix-hairpin-helix domain-containing protein [Candidatus Omnitrophota bacterium]